MTELIRKRISTRVAPSPVPAPELPTIPAPATPAIVTKTPTPTGVQPIVDMTALVRQAGERRKVEYRGKVAASVDPMLNERIQDELFRTAKGKSSLFNISRIEDEHQYNAALKAVQKAYKGSKATRDMPDWLGGDRPDGGVEMNVVLEKVLEELEDDDKAAIRPVIADYLEKVIFKNYDFKNVDGRMVAYFVFQHEREQREIKRFYERGLSRRPQEIRSAEGIPAD